MARIKSVFVSKQKIWLCKLCQATLKISPESWKCLIPPSMPDQTPCEWPPVTFEPSFSTSHARFRTHHGQKFLLAALNMVNERRDQRIVWSFERVNYCEQGCKANECGEVNITSKSIIEEKITLTWKTARPMVKKYNVKSACRFPKVLEWKRAVRKKVNF